MGRLIDETEVMRDIDAIRPVDPQKSDYAHDIDVGLAMAKLAIKEQQTAQQWIPCSEQLPKNNKDVLITCEWGDVEVGWYDGEWNGEGCVYDDDDIIAWMPLPEPWKGEQE